MRTGNLALLSDSRNASWEDRPLRWPVFLLCIPQEDRFSLGDIVGALEKATTDEQYDALSVRKYLMEQKKIVVIGGSAAGAKAAA